MMLGLKLSKKIGAVQSQISLRSGQVPKYL